MEQFNMDTIKPNIREKLSLFFSELKEGYENIHSLHVTGSAITDDYVPNVSDINTIIVLETMDLAFLDRIAHLGKKYRKKGIAAPLIMTPDYINDSLDVFPLEFLNFKIVHTTVFGPDILSEIMIIKDHLRLQCEREIKSKMIWLRQSYISSMGNTRLLLENIANSISGFIPLFRGIIFLMDKEPSKESHQVVQALGSISHVQTDIFEKVYDIKHNKYKPSKKDTAHLFEEYYHASTKIGSIINDLNA